MFLLTGILRRAAADIGKADVVYEFVGLEPVSEEPGWLEKMMTRLLMALGDLFLSFIRNSLGNDLTIDSVIFNRYEPTIIDMENSRGIFATVLSRLNTVYSQFQNIAAAVYVIAFLYIGIRTMLAIGGPNQAKYRHYFSYWILGLLYMFLVPMFFKYVPKITNSVVEKIGEGTTPQYTYYNIDDDRLRTFGFTEDQIEEFHKGTSGEDTRTAWVELLTGKRDEIYEELQKEQSSYSEEKNKIVEKIKGIVLGFLDGMGTREINEDYAEKAGKNIFNFIENYCKNNDTDKIPDDEMIEVICEQVRNNKNLCSHN